MAKGDASSLVRGRFSAARVSAFCLLTSALPLAGCADLQWHKAGVTAQAMEADLDECRAEARLGAGPDPRFLRADAGRILGMDGAGRPAFGSSGRLDADRFLVEHDLARICMNRRGYELVPAGRSGEPARK
jgi:hypothetical protein